MATSGSIDWSVNRDGIIKAALQRIGVVSVGGTPTSDQYTEGAVLLNGITKSWNATLGMPLWAMSQAYLLPFSGSYASNIGSGHTTTSYVWTTLSAAFVANDTNLTFASITGMGNGYYIGVELDNGDMHWTTINGVPSGSTAILTTGLASAAASGNNVYCYQTKMGRPMRIIQAYSVVGTLANSTSDIPVKVVTVEEFLKLSNKSSEGYPLYLNYEPNLTGNIKIWPRFSNGERVVTFRYHRAIEDFDATADTPDFPQEYFLPLVYELACSLAPQYGKSVIEQQWLRSEADRLLKKVSDYDYEEGSIYFQPGTE